MNKKAIIIGATGLVGKELVKQLSSFYNKVIVIARRPPEIMSNNMRFYQLIDFDNLSEVFENVDLDNETDAFSCLGTTKKQAGCEEAFRKVDYGYNLSFAKLCFQKKVKNFFLVSALGADTHSRFFYNRVKGEIEQDIANIGFDSLYIFRPSLLLGKRKGRPLERLSQKAFKLIAPIISESMPVHPISVKRVAISISMIAHKSYQDTKFRTPTVKKYPIIINNKEMLTMTQVK